MRNIALAILVALAVLGAVACQNSPTGPNAASSAGRELTASPGTWPKTSIDGLVGTWQATKAEGINFWDPNIRRDLVAEGGKVTLVLESGQTGQTYTATLTMPGEAPRVNFGIWYYTDFHGRPQLDFWPGSIPIEELEYGDGMGFYFSLSDTTLSLSDGGGQFLCYDFGWHDAHGLDWAKLELAFTRK